MDVNIIVVSLLCEEEERNQENAKRKRKWVHEICRKRKRDGEFATLFPDLITHQENFFQYFRITHEKFQELLFLLKTDLTRQNTNFRSSIPPEERLAVTFR